MLEWRARAGAAVTSRRSMIQKGHSAVGGTPVRCTKCGTNNTPGNNFCEQCGNVLTRSCAKCKAENPPSSNFCGKCGAPLIDSAVPVGATPSTSESASDARVAPEQPDAADTIEGERKTVTALFADIKGSTELM